MILLISTNETAGNIAVFYYGGHGFCKKKWILAPTRRRRRAVCVMCCGNVFFCALCAGGALVRGEIGRHPHFFVVCAGWPGAWPIV